MKRPPVNSRRLGTQWPRRQATVEVMSMTQEAEVRPLQPIRRFDVFAEIKRLEALAHGKPDDVAKGYGIRIAKIVASRRFGGSKAKKTHHDRDDTPEGESSAGS